MIRFYHIDLDEKVVMELSSHIECTGDKIIKQINQKTNEILLSIKTQLANAKPATAQTSETLGKLCSLLLYTVMIINGFLCELFRSFEYKIVNIKTRNFDNKYFSTISFFLHHA